MGASGSTQGARSSDVMEERGSDSPRVSGAPPEEEEMVTQDVGQEPWLMQCCLAPCAASKESDALEIVVDDLDVAAAPVTGAAASSSELEGALTLLVRVEYPWLPRGSTMKVFGLVTIQAAAMPQGCNQRQPMDIICCLDVSGSMAREKLDQVQSAVRSIAAHSKKRDALAVVTFNNRATVDLGLRKMDLKGRNEAIAVTLQLQARGRKSIRAGLSRALAVMEQRAQRRKVATILLFTDGKDPSLRTRIPALVARASAAHCSIYCFGLGVDHDAAVLSTIAEQVLAGTMGRLRSTVAQDLRLSLSGRAALTAVRTPFPTQRVSETRVAIVIPSAIAGERHDVLVELQVPTREFAPGRMVLLEASLQYTDIERETEVEIPAVRMETSCCEQEQPGMESDEEVSQCRERVEVARALSEAARRSEQGWLGQGDHRGRGVEAAAPRSEAW
eukprot:NODE_237_length_1769_cov_293.317386.p1 GENE.NODE_237_length_1769_cov_293.317386~~NODE_237_length_1769_cov_293.317386.p1  ORF type:complete len:446 (-),score=126.12 NODE_237_length_1769_cov_293.317386:302-1639(-)